MAAAFERKYKLVITRRLPSTGAVEYWQWGNRWTVEKSAAHSFERDFDAAVVMVENVISHGKVVEDRGT